MKNARQRRRLSHFRMFSEVIEILSDEEKRRNGRVLCSCPPLDPPVEFQEIRGQKSCLAFIEKMIETGDVDHLWNIAVDLYTAFLFTLVSCCFIGLCYSYLVVQLVRDTWISFLAKRFPDLDFDRSESLKCVLDSPRNVGVLVALLTIRGRCDFDVICHRLWTEVVDKRGANGRPAFRRLRMVLTSRWGCYAWSNSQFSLDNHITLGSGVYRGRAVTEHNIQEMVNEIVNKYLVAGVPPWHLTVIPTTTGDRYYLLLRVHHLLFSAESGMRLCDFLAMINGKRVCAPSVGFHTMPTHPFRDLYKQPKALPILWEQVSQSFSNQWNEFLAAYDPLENPAVLKSPGIKAIAAVAVIGLIASLKNAVKRSNKHEVKRRELTLKLLLTAIRNSLSPLSLVGRLMHYVYWFIKFASIKLPLFAICEFWSLCMINDEQYAERSFIKKLINGWTRVKAALKEISYFCRLAYNGPRVLLEDLWLKKSTSPHYLQSVSHAGRKVISWSQPVPYEVFEAIQEATGATRCDVLLTATAAALRDFFLLHDNSAPDVVLAVAQAISQDELLKTVDRTGQGILCLAIPTNHAWDVTDGPIAELHTMQQVILRSRIRQPALYLASKLQLDYQFFTKSLPWHLMRLIMNWLSRSFTVSITDVYQPSIGLCNRKRQLQYQEVESLLYWTPNQANIGVSITLISHADEVIMCVMSDAQLAPHHAIISSTFGGHVRRLALAAGVLTPPFPQNIPTDDCDDQSEPNSLTTSSSQYSVDYDTPDLEP